MPYTEFYNGDTYHGVIVTPLYKGINRQFAGIVVACDEDECSHIRDNQGFCHHCGVPVCEESLKASGYWKDGMICEPYDQ